MTGLEITEVVIPGSVEVRSAVWSHDSGTQDEVRPPEEMLPGWRKQEFEPKRMLLARLDGRPVGRALAERVEALAREARATKFIVYAPCWRVGGPRLAAPTAFGDVAADTPETRLLQSFGYRLEQVERGSRLPLPVDAAVLEAMQEEAGETAGDEYRIHTWVDATPPEWREDIAHLLTRMSTDAPSAGLEESEDPWTVERLLADEALEEDSPTVRLVAAVEHVPSGRLAGFTELVLPENLARPVGQEDTIVVREHRGHRLGMLLKIANIAHLQRVRPGHPRIVTYNAEENRHMLDVNEASGFEPFVYEGAWRKDVPA